MPKVISQEIKEKILYLSKNNYLRQGEIAKMCGVSRPMVSALVNGRRTTKKENALRKQRGYICPITGWAF